MQDYFEVQVDLPQIDKKQNEAFNDIDSNYCNFCIWRIEKFELVEIPHNKYGEFYDGDSYIVYLSYTQNCLLNVDDLENLPRPANGVVEQHIHFWLGKNTSQDEQAVAAIRTIELDDKLGGVPVQHREVQGHESKQFRAYFNHGIKILNGGVASGFNEVVADLTPRLFIVKGKRCPSVRQLPQISFSEFNHGDCFILHVRESKIIFVWIGCQCCISEKIQAHRFANELRVESHGGSIEIVEDGKEEMLGRHEFNCFKKYLALEERNQIKLTGEAEADDFHDSSSRSCISLYHCFDSEVEGLIRIKKVKDGPLDQSDLSSDDSYIIDNGNNGIWIWSGKNSSKFEKVGAIQVGQSFIKQKGYDNHSSVVKVVDQGEPYTFKSLFKSWKNPYDANVGVQVGNKTNIAVIKKENFDANLLHNNPKKAAEVNLMDNGSGNKIVYRVHDSEIVEINPEEIGIFYSGDSYIVVYDYKVGSVPQCLIYFWLGLHCSQQEKASAAIKTVFLDDERNGEAVQVRVVQGKEPPHFLAIFQQKFVIREGGRGFDMQPNKRYLLQVHGNNFFNTKAVEVPLRASSLNSNDCFILVDFDHVYFWVGNGANGPETHVAFELAKHLNPECEQYYEGKEMQIFWDALGGKEPYISDNILSDDKNIGPVRLFHCSNASGNFKVEEFLNFSQQDLIPEDVMLLDAYSSLFVWVGALSRPEEKSECLLVAKEYLRSDPSGRDLDIPIYVVKQGMEPPHFIGHFGPWDHTVWKKYVENEKVMMKQQLMEAKDEEHVAEFYAYSELKSKAADKLPAGFDVDHRELYLSDSDFVSVFGVSKEEFKKYPNWRQIEFKKKVGLF